MNGTPALPPKSRADAQSRVDEIRVFQLELGRLERERVVTLSADQAAKINAHHSALLETYSSAFDIDKDIHAKQLSLGMRVSSFFGALALAASAFFLFYQFWGLFSTPLQVLILLAAALGSFGAVILIRGKEESGYFTKLAAMVCFACFVLNIAMLGQIFNITPSDKAFLPWAAFAFLLAYTCDLRLLLVAGIFCISAFVSARMGTWGGMYWLDLGSRPENFLPAALLIFLAPRFIDHARFAGFDAVYRVLGMIAFLLPVLAMGNWGTASYLPLDPTIIEGFYQVLGFVASALAVWLGTKRNLPHIVNTGVAFFVIFLYTKIYDWWWEIMPKYLFFLVLGLISLLLLFVLRRVRRATA